MEKQELEAVLKIGQTLDAVIANLMDHLKNEHKMENHGYLGKGQDATLLFFLQNCHTRLIDDMKPLRDARDTLDDNNPMLKGESNE